MGNFHSACIMLGYTIETTMKAGLMEVLTHDEQRNNNILNRSHNIKHIYAECIKHDLFANINVSNDFIEHIDYHFQRYPSQMQKTLENANKQNKVISNSNDWLFYYDDLIVQLDDYLLNRASDTMISIIYHAMYTLETKYARDVLQENAFVIMKFEKYADLVRENMPARDDLKAQIEENLSKGALFYWDAENKTGITNEQISSIAQKYSAVTFKLPKWNLKNGRWETLIP